MTRRILRTGIYLLLGLPVLLLLAIAGGLALRSFDA